MALACILVETIQAFREGLRDTKNKSKELFKRFLTTTSPFNEHFSDGKFAEDFFDDFRCGILHQAETKGGSLVWSVGRLVWRSTEGIVVNRNEFANALKFAFDSYLGELRKR